MSDEEFKEYRAEVHELRIFAERMDEMSNMHNDCDLGDIAFDLERYIDKQNA